MSSGEGDIAFVELPALPEYKPCMLKKNIKTNDDEIYEIVKQTGTAYYKYFAITVDDEEKKYVKTFSEAEDVVNKLKEKDSTNKDKLAIVEKYAIKKADKALENKEKTNDTDKTEQSEGSEESEENKDDNSASDTIKSAGETAGLPEFATIELASVDDVVDELYVARPKITYTSTAYQSVYEGGAAVPTDLGVTLISPVSGLISSRYGMRARDNHPGLDIAAPTGTSIFAAAPGTVVAAGYTAGYSGYGNIVVIQSSDALSIRYGHCSAVFVSVGQQVAQGQCIAAVGSTGWSTGPHLHFEIRYYGATVNPQNYLY